MFVRCRRVHISGFYIGVVVSAADISEALAGFASVVLCPSSVSKDEAGGEPKIQIFALFYVKNGILRLGLDLLE